MNGKIKECFDAILDNTNKLSKFITEPDELTAVKRLQFEMESCKQVFERTKNLNDTNSQWEGKVQ